MEFKIKNTSIKISFSFLLLFLFFSISDNLSVYLCSISAALLHEAVHVLFILYFKDSIKKITFNVLGGKIEKTNKMLLSNGQEAIINLSAPITNILIGVIFLAIKHNSLWGITNLFIGCFNVLPFSAFDGGRGLFYLLSQKLSYQFAIRISHICSVVVFFIFISFSVYSFIHFESNYFLFLISAFMFVAVFFEIEL